MNKPTTKPNALRAAITIRAAIFWLGCALVGQTLHAAEVGCKIYGAPLAFASYDTFSSSPTLGNGNVSVSCINLGPGDVQNTLVTLTVGDGIHGGANDRSMVGGNGSLLHYGIFSDPGLTNSLGSGSPGIQQSTGPIVYLHTTPLNFPLFGRIAPLQNVQAGSYNDNVIITVTP